MKRDNLLFFIEQIVDLNIANKELCDDRRGYEARIKELEDSIISHKERINEITDGNKCDKEELNMRIKELEAHEIKPWSNDKRILETLQENIKLKERIKELEEQLAHSYDSGLEAVHPEDTTEHYLPEPTPEERKAYNKDRIREFIKEHLQEDPRDYPEEHSE